MRGTTFLKSDGGFPGMIATFKYSSHINEQMPDSNFIMLKGSALCSSTVMEKLM